VHVAGDDEFLDFEKHLFAFGEKVWNDPSDVAATGNRRAGDFAHQSHAAAAVDKFNAGTGKSRSQCLGSIDIGRVRARAGATIDAHGSRVGVLHRILGRWSFLVSEVVIVHISSIAFGLPCAKRPSLGAHSVYIKRGRR